MVWDPNLEGRRLLFSVNLASTVLSLVGSFCMTYFCLRNRKSKVTSFKFITAIGISDAFYSIANLMSAFENESMQPLCYIEGFVRQCSLIFTLLFTASLAIFCGKLVGTASFNQERFFKCTVALGVFLNLCYTISPFLFPGDVWFLNGELYCEIGPSIGASKLTQIYVVTSFISLPIIMAILITLISYVLTIRRLNRFLSKSILQHLGVKTVKLLWYPAVLSLTFAPCLIDSAINTYFDTQTGLIVQTIHLVMNHSIGFSNSIIYAVQNTNSSTFENESSEPNTDPESRNMSHNLLLNSSAGDRN